MQLRVAMQQPTGDAEFDQFLVKRPNARNRFASELSFLSPISPFNQGVL